MIRFIYSLLTVFLFSLSLSAEGNIITSSGDYSALAEAPMEKLISDSFGNLYALYRIRTSGAYQQWVYTSYDHGRSWTPIGNSPIHIFKYDQRRGSLAIDKNGKIYAVWTGADEENTGTYFDPSTGKQVVGLA